MRVAILFTDGVGVGARNPDVNPLARGEFLLSQFADGSGTRLPESGARTDVDTTFDVPGRPQSASNQTAIFTGAPAPQLLGKHVLGFPTPPLRALLQERSIVRAIRAAGRTATFANAFPRAYLQALGLPHDGPAADPTEVPRAWRRRLRPSASTLAMAAGGVPFRSIEDAQAERALTHDVDGALAHARVGAPRRSPERAAEIFWSLAADLTLFEHFLADEAGHAQDFEAAHRAIDTFDRFARAVIDRRPADAQVVIVSDHGNVEDLSIRSHTRNPVAVLTFGEAPLPPLQTVADVGRAALQWLGAHA